MSVASPTKVPRPTSRGGLFSPALGTHSQEIRPTDLDRPVSTDALAADPRGEFLAMVLHELRNPLSNILAGIEFARDAEGLAPKCEWLWSGIEVATCRVQNLADDLMGLCDATFPAFKLKQRLIDLAEFVRLEVEARQTTLKAGGLQLVCVVPTESVWMLVDPERLRLILANLIENAAKYTPHGGTVTVSLEAAEEEVVVCVRDTGIGIAADVLPFVFDPFVREKYVEVQSKHGSGIGLLLVKRLVESHGGSIEAKSEGRGRGAEFAMRFPVGGAD